MDTIYTFMIKTSLPLKNRVFLGDRTKARNGLGNGLKNRSIKLEICSPSGHVKSFHIRSLSALVTRTSMQVSRALLAEH